MLVGSFNEGEVKRLLNIPEKFSVVALLSVGYSREKLDMTAKAVHFFMRRKELEKIVSLEEFGKPVGGLFSASSMAESIR